MRFYVYCGLLLWIAATLLFRLWGEELIHPDKLLIWFSFILVVPGILLLLNGLFRYKGTAAADRPKAAVLIAAPGMFLDLFSIGFHPLFFPNIPAAHLHLFFVWLLWAYSLILIGGIAKFAKIRLSR